MNEYMKYQSTKSFGCFFSNQYLLFDLAKCSKNQKGWKRVAINDGPLGKVQRKKNNQRIWMSLLDLPLEKHKMAAAPLPDWNNNELKITIP